ncbi:unnamed protein product [Effrenium voratum]|uniref:Uncharacterized protein n=1 Tax=Effrenium voratum TaxID=2562239 RepID=A0AA36JIS3_9DINO|nr:unnamed protein product [Effrenium voratum]
MAEPFTETICDEGGFNGTWRDFLTSPENEGGGFVEVKEKGKKKKKKVMGGRYGVAIEEAVKAEMRGHEGAVGHVLELINEKCGHNPHGMEELMKSAERTEKKTKKCLEKGKHHKLPVWEESDSSSSSD